MQIFFGICINLNNIYMATVKFYLDKRRVKKDGTFPIKLNVFHNKQMMIATQLSASEKDWDGNGFSTRSQNYKPKNIVARGIINKAEDVILSLEKQGNLKSTTDAELKRMIEKEISTKNKNKEKRFIDYLDEFVSKKNNLGTKSIYNTTRNKILGYDPKCTFDSMDKKWLERFEAHMAKTMKVNAYAIHLRNIRAVFNYAIDEEYTTSYPFRRFLIKKEKTRKRALTLEQFRELKDFQCEDYLERYRDLFILMFYLIGINASDLFSAKKKDIVNGRLEYKRQKTGKLYSIKIEPEAKEIIEKYSGNETKGYLLNVMDDYNKYNIFLHSMNIGLKKIGKSNPMFLDLSSYWSRHTWATIAAGLDIPKETIAHALGHSWADSTTTDIYIRFDEKKVDKANREVINFVFGK